jgi:hypothetical protein
MSYESYLLLASAPIWLVLSYFVLPYLFNSTLRKYPGPPGAAISQLWLARTSRNGARSKEVHAQHLKHGKVSSRYPACIGRPSERHSRSCLAQFVRIGPNESEYASRSMTALYAERGADRCAASRPVSIADPAALPLVYAHGSGSYVHLISPARVSSVHVADDGVTPAGPSLNSTTRSSPSTAGCSTRATVPNTLASARSSLTPSPPSRCESSSLTSLALFVRSSRNGMRFATAPRRREVSARDGLQLSCSTG